MSTVRVQEETSRGESIRSVELEPPDPTVTARELIRTRVHDKVRLRPGSQVSFLKLVPLVGG